jgi:glycosyltransferase involved in cell wall biosynthesis
MRICVFSYTGFERLDGSNLRVFFLVKEMIKRGHYVTFVTANKEYAESCKKRFDVTAKHINLNINRFNKNRLKLYPRFAYRASKSIPKETDLAFGQSLPSALAVRRSRYVQKKVVDFVDLWSEYWMYAHPAISGRLVYRGIRKAEGYSMKGSDMVFTITNTLKNMIKERGCSEDKIRIVRDGVDTRMFRPMKVPGSLFERYGLEKEGEYVTYQGGIAAHDGVQFLLDAAPLVLKENPDVKFLIVGAGDYAEKLRMKVSKSPAKESFIFTGWIPYGDMPSFMNISRINAVPLPNAPATQGVVTLKLFEAMACGTPTIIGDLPGPREHVEHGKSAYLVRSEDRRALAAGINELLGDGRLYRRIKSGGLDMIPNYDWRKIASEMTHIMESLKK